MIKVIKRDCSEIQFDKNKISKAIFKAMKNGSGIIKPKIADDIATEIEQYCIDNQLDNIDISDIESMVYDKLISKKKEANSYYKGHEAIIAVGTMKVEQAPEAQPEATPATPETTIPAEPTTTQQ